MAEGNFLQRFPCRIRKICSDIKTRKNIIKKVITYKNIYFTVWLTLDDGKSRTTFSVRVPF